MYLVGLGYLETFGQRLRRLREGAQFSRRALAIRIEGSDTYIEKLEAGTIRKPSHENLVRLAGVLGVSVDYLVSGEVVENEKQSEEAWVREMISTLVVKGLPPKQADRLSRLAWSLLPTDDTKESDGYMGAQVPHDADSAIDGQAPSIDSGEQRMVAEENGEYRART